MWSIFASCLWQVPSKSVGISLLSAWLTGWLDGFLAQWWSILPNGGSMIHSGPLDYFISIPSGAWDRPTCRWCITCCLFFLYIPRSFPLSISLCVPRALKMTPFALKGGCKCWTRVTWQTLAVFSAAPPPQLPAHFPTSPTPLLQPATATRLAFDLIPA